MAIPIMPKKYLTGINKEGLLRKMIAVFQNRINSGITDCTYKELGLDFVKSW